jgi:hypothetical protein
VQNVPTNRDDAGTLKKNPAGNEYDQPVTQFQLAGVLTAISTQFHHPAPTIIHSFITAPFHPPQG